MADTPVMKIVPPYTPELLPEVQGLIEKNIKSIQAFEAREPKILELGSGWSTVWFASMMNLHTTLISLEHNREWLWEVRDTLKNNFNIHEETPWFLEPKQFSKKVASQFWEFDLILIDCIDEARLPSLFASLTRLSPGGWLVLDDSHWDMFEGVPTVMRNLGYNFRTISGEHVRKTGEMKFHQTTIFSKGAL